MFTTLLISIISTAVVYAATVLYAAVGEIFSQRAGIMNLGLEGIMLMGAVSGYMVAVYRQNLLLAMLVVILVGAVLGLIFSFLTVTMQADQTVSAPVRGSREDPGSTGKRFLSGTARRTAPSERSRVIPLFRNRGPVR